MDIIKRFIPCCLGASHDELLDESTGAVGEKCLAYTDNPSTTELQSTAHQTSIRVLRLITTTDALNTPALNMHMQEIITSNKPIAIQSSYWTKLVLNRLYKAMIELVTKMGEMRDKFSPVMRKVIDDAEHFAHELQEFQEKHPILAAFIETAALAILIEVLAPFLLEALSFGIEGVVEGECSIFILLAMLLTDDVQAVSLRDSSRSTLTFPMVLCSQNGRVSLPDTERVCVNTEVWGKEDHSRTRKDFLLDELEGVGEDATRSSVFLVDLHTYIQPIEIVSLSTD